MTRCQSSVSMFSILYGMTRSEAFVTDSPPHRRLRVSGEPPLKQTRQRVTDSRQQLAGMGERIQVVPDGSVAPVPLDAEPLFPNLAVPGQCAVSEPVPLNITLFLEHVDDAAGVQRPEAEVFDDDGDNRPLPDRGGGGVDTTPTHVAHPTRTNGRHGPLERLFPLTKSNPVMVYVVTRGRRAARGPHFRISERQRPLRVEKRRDGRS